MRGSGPALPSGIPFVFMFRHLSCSITVRQFLMILMFPPVSSLLGIPRADFDERIVNLTMVDQTYQFTGVRWGYDEDMIRI